MDGLESERGGEVCVTFRIREVGQKSGHGHDTVPDGSLRDGSEHGLHVVVELRARLQEGQAVGISKRLGDETKQTHGERT